VWEDLIVSEVRRTREKLAAQFGFDVKAIFADLRSRQIALGRRLVSRKNQAEPTDAVDRGPLAGPAHDEVRSGGPGN
jgi:hypothetical protein